jgi:hypothetical protein
MLFQRGCEHSFLGLTRSALVFLTLESIMSLTSEFVLRHIVALAFTLAISVACYAVLSLFIWWWLAIMLSMFATWCIEQSVAVQKAKVSACDAAVTGCARALNWYRGLKADPLRDNDQPTPVGDR